MKIHRYLRIWVASVALGACALPASAATTPDQPTGTLEQLSESEFAARLDAEGQLARGNAAFSRGDYAEAFRIFRNIAVLGVPEAHFRLGQMYAAGLGTRKSSRQAEYWLNLAARENVPGATEALASVKISPAGS